MSPSSRGCHAGHCGPVNVLCGHGAHPRYRSPVYASAYASQPRPAHYPSHRQSGSSKNAQPKIQSQKPGCPKASMLVATIRVLPIHAVIPKNLTPLPNTNFEGRALAFLLSQRIVPTVKPTQRTAAHNPHFHTLSYQTHPIGAIGRRLAAAPSLRIDWYRPEAAEKPPRDQPVAFLR